METFRKILNFIWRKSFIIIPITMIVFFLIGFIKNYHYHNNLKEEVLYGNEYSQYAKEYYLAVYDFSDDAIISGALMVGLAEALVYPFAIFYLLMLATFCVSTNNKLKTVGITLATITAVLLLAYGFFVINFHFEF